MVDAKPFLMLGGQVGNFSAYPDIMERAWPGFKAMILNTVEYPVYWNVIEPEEGRFDFSGFDRILTGLRSQGLRAILL
jgi:beta-galactosidase GanA